MATKPDLDTEALDRRPSLLEALVGYQLRRASNRMLSDFAATMGPLALRPALFAMLEVVRANPGIIQMALGTELGIQRANLVPLINELTARDLIDRQPAPNDRRALTLYLTPEGARVLDEAEKLVRAHEEKMLSALSGAEREKLIELLGKIAAD